MPVLDVAVHPEPNDATVSKQQGVFPKLTIKPSSICDTAGKSIFILLMLAAVGIAVLIWLVLRVPPEHIWRGYNETTEYQQVLREAEVSHFVLLPATCGYLL